MDSRNLARKRTRLEKPESPLASQTEPSGQFSQYLFKVL